MKRFGASGSAMGSMTHHNIFMERLYLLAVMVKAGLNGYPVGAYRRQAAIENADAVYAQLDQTDLSFLGLSSSVHLFKQRTGLLCVMAKAIFTQSSPLGTYRRKAIEDNLGEIVRLAFGREQMEWFEEMLKVA